MNNKKKEARVIFNMGVARALFRAGCTAIDCKTDRSDPNKTVIVFKNDELFQREFARINKEIAEAKAQAQEDK